VQSRSWPWSNVFRDAIAFERVLHNIARLPNLKRLSVLEPSIDIYVNEEHIPFSAQPFGGPKVFPPMLPCISPSLIVSNSVCFLELSGFVIVNGALSSIASIFPRTRTLDLSSSIANIKQADIGNERIVQQAYRLMEKEACCLFSYLEDYCADFEGRHNWQ